MLSAAKFTASALQEGASPKGLSLLALSSTSNTDGVVSADRRLDSFFGIGAWHHWT